MQNAPIVRLIESLSVDSFWGVLKLLIVFGILMYVVFSLVMIRQAQLMVKTLNGQLDLPVIVVAVVHFVVAVGVFVLALVVL